MFPATLTRPSNGHIRRILIVALATLMLFATLAVLPSRTPAASANGTEWLVDYWITFAPEDQSQGPGTTVPGTSQSKELVGVQVYGTTLGAIHASCSDKFGLYDAEWNRLPDPLDPDTWGYGTEGSPTSSEPRIWDFGFDIYKNGELFKQCGNTTPPPELGTLIVEKVTDPPGSQESFTFTTNYGDLGFSLAHGESNSAQLQPGTYSVDETALPDGWELFSATCDNDSPVNAIALAANEIVTCTFTNLDGTAPPNPSIHIEKATNGEDADDPTGPNIPLLGAVTWTYVVTNTGNVALSDVVVTDNRLADADITGPTGDDNSDGVLDLDETWEYTATGTAQWHVSWPDLAGVEYYKNTGTVNAKAGDTPVGDSDPSHYAPQFVCPPVIAGSDYVFDFFDVTPYPILYRGGERVGPANFVLPAGDYDVTLASYDAHSLHGGGGQTEEIYQVDLFDGTTMIASSIPISDLPDDEDMLVELLSTELHVPSDTTRIQAFHSSLQTGWNSISPLCVGFDKITPPVPSIDIEKATNGQDADTPTGPTLTVDDPVTWTYVVTNNGEVDLTGVIVTDDVLGDVCTIGDLAVGETKTCTKTGVAALGQYANLGTVVDNNGDGSTVEDSDWSHYLGVAALVPSIDIEKATNGQDADTPTGPTLTVDDPVTWTYVVTNNGEVDLTGVIVTDDVLGDVCTIGDLAIGATKTCTKTGVAALGQYANLGTVVDNNGDGSTVEDSDWSHYLGVAAPVPSIDIEKATNGQDADGWDNAPTITEGDSVEWTYVVTNDGEVDLTGVIVTDDVLGDVCTIGDLAIGATKTCTKTGVAGAADYANLGTVVGFYGDLQITDTDPSHYKALAFAGTAQLGDTVWLDANNNGIQDAGEVGYNGAKVILTDADGNVVGTLTTATGAWVGFYKFLTLDAGTYTASLDLATIEDYEVTTAKSFTVTLAEGDDFVAADFGLYKEEELPKTGVDSEGLTLFALGLLMLGGLAVLSTRKRRAEER